MKKILISAVIVFFSLLIAAPIVNNSISRKTADELASLPLPKNTEVIESVYKAEKLTGNGNGMQYFGAILIKSELSLEELKEYYSRLAQNEWDYIVEEQRESDIKVIEHGKLEFKTNITGDDYYIVYSWGGNNTIFHELDIRGH